VPPGYDEARIMKNNKSLGPFFPPSQSFTLTRRTLPHWQNSGSVITWNCQNHQIHSEAERTITLEAIRFWDQTQWLLYTAVIMPDHVHLLAQPLPAHEEESLTWGKS
jgi:hypothetical protein